MKKVSRLRIWLVAGSLVGVGTVAASGASACFPLPVLVVQPRASGAVGSKVTVEGVDFGDEPTEIRWNAIDGPVLAHGSPGAFVSPITIPPAEDGVYAVVAFARRIDGSVGVKAATPFQVISDSGSTGSPNSTTNQASGSSSSSTATKSSGTFLGLSGMILGLSGMILIIGALTVVFLVRRRQR